MRQANLRGIGLTLEALRAVDRYGATKSGEQYRGYTALPPGDGGDGGKSRGSQPGPGAAKSDGFEALRAAATVLLEEAGLGITPETIDAMLVDAEYRREIYRAAAHKAHPDKGGGDHETFLAVQAAMEALNL